MEVEKQDSRLMKIDHEHDQKSFGQDFSGLIIFFLRLFWETIKVQNNINRIMKTCRTAKTEFGVASLQLYKHICSWINIASKNRAFPFLCNPQNQAHLESTPRVLK